MLTTMRDEWRIAAELRDGGPAPTWDEYVANADGCGFRFLRVTDWLTREDADLLPHLELLMQAAWEAEVAARLRNDLGTWQREQGLIDLNALRLGIPRRTCSRGSTPAPVAVAHSCAHCARPASPGPLLGAHPAAGQRLL